MWESVIVFCVTNIKLLLSNLFTLHDLYRNEMIFVNNNDKNPEQINSM